MTFTRLVFNSLKFHARSHLGVLLGAMLGSGILTGALIVGDSVRGSLEQIALMRLGKIDLAMTSGDRFFSQELAEKLAANNTVDATATPLLVSQGVAVSSDQSSRANQVQILGVTPEFWQLAQSPPDFSETSQDGVILNQRLADHLEAQIGDSILLRIQKPALLSREAPVTPQEDFSVSLRINVAAIVTGEEFGRFSLQANQVPPYNAYLPLATLQERIEQTDRANLLLISGTSNSQSDVSLDAWNDLIQSNWTLEDAELELRELTDVNMLELRSRRVFLDDPIITAAEQSGTNGRGVLTYFVNEFLDTSNTNTTPYSFVAGMENWPQTEGIDDNSTVINQWLAEDLSASVDDAISMTYFVVGQSQRLEERTNTFRVAGIIPMEGEAADQELLPEFPGIASAENPDEWDAGFKIDLDKVRDKDDQYWQDFRGTPKAFVTLSAAQEMWANRFGSATAVRFPSSSNEPSEVVAQLLRTLNPADIGFMVVPIREQGLAASSQSFDFGGLFIGFSFFLIIAALLLMALLFQFGVEQRADEIGTLLALGFRNQVVRYLLLLEGCVIAVLGSVLGMLGGIVYAKLMVRGLSTIWSDAVSATSLYYHANPSTLLIGAASGAAVCIFTIWLSVRKQADRPVRELMEAGKDLASSELRANSSNRSLWVAAVTLVVGISVAIFGASLQGPAASGAFFGAGSLLLIAGITICSVWFQKLGLGSFSSVSMLSMSLRGVTRRRKRSLTIVACLACGCFLIIAIEPFRLDANVNANERSSGTGGFAFLGETTVPVVHNLKTQDGWDFYGLDAGEMADISVVPMRLRAGDDASCLNLNRAQQPRLLGVNPTLLSDRGAFSFSGSIYDLIPEDVRGWDMLNIKLDDGSIPAVGDIASIQWALGKKIGDTLTYVDDEGNSFEVRLVGGLTGSILQGSILISEENLTRMFPSISGYQSFLIDAPDDSEADAMLTRALEDTGLEMISTVQRLSELNAVQNTYLSTFQVLGGLGLVLGTVGLGIVVLRNVLERRGELALLEAVGFQTKSLRRSIICEHGALLVLGIVIGSLAAAVAVGPILAKPENEVPLGSLLLTLLGIFTSGLLWTWLAATFSLRGKLIDALRND